MVKTFSKWLDDSQLSQQEAAEKLGVCQTTIHNWRSGKTAPSLKHLAIIAKVCEVPINKLLPNDMEVEIKAPSIGSEILKIDALKLYEQIFELNNRLMKSKEEEIALKNAELASKDKLITELQAEIEILKKLIGKKP